MTIPTERLPFRFPLHRLLVSLFTLGSGSSLWLLLAFVCGALILGLASNLIFTWLTTSGVLTVDGAAKVLGACAGLAFLALWAFQRDQASARHATRLAGYIRDEDHMPPHTGLIWLLSRGPTLLAEMALRYHRDGPEHGRLRHVWVLISPNSQGVYETFKARLVELGLTELDLHPVSLPAPSIEATAKAVQMIYTNELKPLGLQPDEVVSDLTGGLKTMTAGMVWACLSNGWPLEYIDSMRDANGVPIEGAQVFIRVGVGVVMT